MSTCVFHVVNSPYLKMSPHRPELHVTCHVVHVQAHMAMYALETTVELQADMCHQPCDACAGAHGAVRTDALELRGELLDRQEWREVDSRLVDTYT